MAYRYVTKLLIFHNFLFDMFISDALITYFKGILIKCKLNNMHVYLTRRKSSQKTV